MYYYLRLTALFFVLALFCVVYPQKVYAYLDPGTGSYILQLIIAAFFGVGFAVKVYWKKIKSFFHSHFSKTHQDMKK